jgi:hypothetical protein
LISLSGSSSDEVLVAAGLLPAPSKPLEKHVPDNLSSVDQLWPQLVKLVEPYGLRKREDSAPITKEAVGEVRREADDLSDPAKLEREAAGRR